MWQCDSRLIRHQFIKSQPNKIFETEMDVIMWQQSKWNGAENIFYHLISKQKKTKRNLIEIYIQYEFSCLLNSSTKFQLIHILIFSPFFLAENASYYERLANIFGNPFVCEWWALAHNVEMCLNLTLYLLAKNAFWQITQNFIKMESCFVSTSYAEKRRVTDRPSNSSPSL